MSRPPSLPKFLLSACLHPADRETVMGDLEEMYALAHRRRGRVRAAGWYWTQVLRSAPKFLVNSVLWKSIMIANYAKLTFRNLNKQRLHGGINIAGLSLGIALCVLIMLFVRDELTYDRFHEGHENLYQVQSHYFEADGSLRDWNPNGPLPLGRDLIASVPGIEKSTRLWDDATFARVGPEIFQQEALYVDAAFLDMFSFGLDGSALPREGLVLTLESAARLFGGSDALGQNVQLRIGGVYRDHVVTGIVSSPPGNSTFQFEMLIPIEALIEARYSERRDGYDYSMVETYIQTRSDQDPEVLAGNLDTFHDKVRGSWNAGLRERIDFLPGIRPATFHALPLAEVHLRVASSPLYSYILTALALGILLIACINFMTMAIGRSLSRSTEVGVRKVMGAVRAQLVGQFWGEAILVVLMSAAVGLLMAWAALPWFNQLTGKQLAMQMFADWTVIGGMFALVLVTGLIAGSYPALVMSAFRPIDVLKSRLRVGGSNWFTRGLVALQFGLSVILIIGTLTMKKQTDYLKSRELGFDTEQVVLVRLNGLDGPATTKRFREALASSPNVLGVTVAASALGYRGSSGMRYDHEGVTYNVDMMSIDHQFRSEMGIELTRGRDFDPARAADSLGAVLVNEALVKAFGMDDPIGQEIPGMSEEGGPVIVGVTADFNYQSLYQEVGPLMMAIEDYWGYGYMYVRLAPGSVTPALEELTETWASVTADVPFSFEFLDDRMERVYASDLRWQRIIQGATFSAILLALLGLFGLASITVRGRLRELGIRKVLGASTPGLIGLIARDFLGLILIGSVLAFPVAYVVTNKWMTAFAFQANVGPGVYLSAVLLVLLAAALAVGSQSLRAAAADPVGALRVD